MPESTGAHLSRPVAPDLIGATKQPLDGAYPVRIVVNDHELGRITLKLTDGMATTLLGELSEAIR